MNSFTKTILITGGAGFIGSSNYQFVKGDICNQNELEKIFSDFHIDNVIHLAAESHVDRSISNPLEFVQTNVLGTVNLLNVAKNYWDLESGNVFYHVSTDEVYGSLGEEGLFLETTPYDPRSPYSASKASSDHFLNSLNQFVLVLETIKGTVSQIKCKC